VKRQGKPNHLFYEREIAMMFEQMMIVFCVIVIAVMTAGSIFVLLRWYEPEKMKKNLLYFGEVNEISFRIAKELAKWQRKVTDFKYLLTGDSWRNSAGKEEFVTAVYEGNMPNYLWYALGEEKLSSDDIDALCELFWDENPKFGDLELHVSNNPEVKTALRIRNPKRFVTEIVMNGKTYPLYQTGHSMFGAPEAGCISFIKLCNKEAIV